MPCSPTRLTSPADSRSARPDLCVGCQRRPPGASDHNEPAAKPAVAKTAAVNRTTIYLPLSSVDLLIFRSLRLWSSRVIFVELLSIRSLGKWQLPVVRVPAVLRPEIVMVDVIANAGPEQGACVLISAEVDSSINARIRDVIGDLLES